VNYPLEDLKVPVLVVHGTKDPMLPFDSHAREYARRAPNVELLAVEGGEHVAIFTHQNEVRPGVADFMQRYFSLGRATC
jgi:pimeloyl-ACP methyl ester carboxylesterase